MVRQLEKVSHMSRPFFALFAVACLAPTSEVRSAEPPAKPDAAALVRQLGDESFEVRERAAAALRELGLAAEAALRQGLQSPDAEVRSACAGLLAQARRDDREARLEAFLADKEGTSDHGLAGWPRFAELVGRDPAGRALFAVVQRADDGLLEAAEKEPRQAAHRLAARTGTLAVALVTPRADDSAFTEAVILLFVASDTRVPVDAAAFAALCRGMEVLANRKALRQRWLDAAPCRRLLLAFLQRRDDVASLELALGVAMTFELKEARDWAVSLATTPTLSATTRGLALLLVGRVGDKELLPKLAPLLSDTTPVGTKPFGAARLSAEIRDVALAVLVQLRGGRAEDYGFPYLQAVPGLKAVPSPACLGFTNPADRDAALKKWQAGRGPN